MARKIKLVSKRTTIAEGIQLTEGEVVGTIASDIGVATLGNLAMQERLVTHKDGELVLIAGMNIEGREYLADDVVGELDSGLSIATLGNLFLRGLLDTLNDGEVPIASDVPPAPPPAEEITPPGSAPEQPEEPQAEAPSSEPADDETVVVDPLVEAGIPEKVAEALRLNAEKLKTNLLLSPDGIRQWVAAGNNLLDLERIGQTRVDAINKALGL